MATVTIRLLSDAAGTPPVEGASVYFYSTSGVLQTSGTTDEDGEVAVSLPDASYDVMFFLQGLSILPRQPQRIVVDSLLVNTFEVSGHVTVLPETTNPRKTRVSGFVIGGDGGGTKTVAMIVPVKGLLNVGGLVVLPESRFEVSSDEDGYFEFDLLRGMTYKAYFRDVDEFLGRIPPAVDLIVPALPGIAFNDLFFPIPLQVGYSVDSLELTAGADADDSVEISIAYTDGNTNEERPGGVPWASLQFSSSDDSIVAVERLENTLILTPRAAGTATILVERTFISEVLWTDPPDLDSGVLTVTVV